MCGLMLVIWRNKEVHDETFSRPPNMAHHIRQAVEIYHRSMLSSVSVVKQKIQRQVHWNRPSHDWVRLNCDGAASLGVAGCGGVLRDAEGNGCGDEPSIWVILMQIVLRCGVYWRD